MLKWMSQMNAVFRCSQTQCVLGSTYIIPCSELIIVVYLWDRSILPLQKNLRKFLDNKVSQQWDQISVKVHCKPCFIYSWHNISHCQKKWKDGWKGIPVYLQLCWRAAPSTLSPRTVTFLHRCNRFQIDQNAHRQNKYTILLTTSKTPTKIMKSW